MCPRIKLCKCLLVEYLKRNILEYSISFVGVLALKRAGGNVMFIICPPVAVNRVFDTFYLFSLQYAILFTIILNISFKYILHTIDLQSENPWESKAVYMLYTDLIMSKL